MCLSYRVGGWVGDRKVEEEEVGGWVVGGWIYTLKVLTATGKVAEKRPIWRLGMQCLRSLSRMGCGGGWVGGLWKGRGDRGGSNEVLYVLYGWVGGWVGRTWNSGERSLSASSMMTVWHLERSATPLSARSRMRPGVPT